MSGLRRRVWVLVAVALTAWPATAAAAAQEDDEGSTTSSTSSSTTSSTDTTTTTTTSPDGSTTVPGPEAPPVADQVPPPVPEEVIEDGAPEEVPPDLVVIPPPVRPPTIDATQVTRVVTRQLLDARDAATVAELARMSAADRVVRLEKRLRRLERTVAALRSDQRQALRRVADAKQTMEERAANAYVRGPLSQVSTVFESEDPNDFLRRYAMVRSVLDADAEALEEYRLAKAALTARLGRLAGQLEELRSEVDGARIELYGVTEAANRSMSVVTAFEAGSAVAVGGFVFPVADPHSFVDTFGAPRMPGTQYEHFHQGTDIFAPSGTPLFACERGVIVRVGNDVLGGIKLWLIGASGHRYYYAHLSAFAEGIQDGLVVEAGDVVGFVGNTGNAVGTPAHLHFEIHPNGGPAANPYPILKVIDDATKKANGPG